MRQLRDMLRSTSDRERIEIRGRQSLLDQREHEETLVAFGAYSSELRDFNFGNRKITLRPTEAFCKNVC
jgi:hypothetical protein